MAKERSISVRLSSETEHKLQWLITETNTGDIAYPLQTLSDVIERCIHNEWVSINMANLSWSEDMIIDPEYVKLIEKRNNSLNNSLTNKSETLKIKE